MSTASPQKDKVGGIRLSRELVQVDVGGQREDGLPGASLLSALAEQKINLTGLTASLAGAPAAVSFCVAASDFGRVQCLIDGIPDLRPRVRVTAAVCALTVFPHRCDLGLLGRLLETFSRAGCPIYGVASSISTLTLNTDHASAGQALTALESVLELPLNHSPYFQEFLVRQV